MFPFLYQSVEEEKEERINVKPRRLPKKRDEDEHSEETKNKPKSNPRAERVRRQMIYQR